MGFKLNGKIYPLSTIDTGNSLSAQVWQMIFFKHAVGAVGFCSIITQLVP